MMKRGAGVLDGWNERYFVLRPERILEYYTDSDLRFRRGEIDLRQLSPSAFQFPASDPSSDPIFTISTPGRVFELNPGTHAACSEWAEKLGPRDSSAQ